MPLLSISVWAGKRIHPFPARELIGIHAIEASFMVELVFCDYFPRASLRMAVTSAAQRSKIS